MIAIWQRLWESRDLALILTISSLKQSTRSTVLGAVWWLLDPILLAGVYTLLVLVIRGGQAPHSAYPAFVMSALLAWKCFASSVIYGTKRIADSDSLIKSYDFPRIVLPVSVVFSNFLLFFIALAPMLGIVLVYDRVFDEPGIRLGWSILFLPCVVVSHALLTIGATVGLSCLGVFFRDVSNLMVHGMRIGWYASPGLYAIHDVLPEYGGLGSIATLGSRGLYLLNPLAHVLEGYRSILLYAEPPDWTGVVYALVVGAAVAFAGGAFFRSQERKFPKLV